MKTKLITFVIQKRNRRGEWRDWDNWGTEASCRFNFSTIRSPSKRYRMIQRTTVVTTTHQISEKVLTG